ncbi:MAG: hypothetical protein ACMG6E_03560, partial [Candidatus Roizmanbacteria bacterium]
LIFQHSLAITKAYVITVCHVVADSETDKKFLSFIQRLTKLWLNLKKLQIKLWHSKVNVINNGGKDF